MPVNFYLADLDFPEIVKGCVTTVIAHYGALLYPDLDLSDPAEVKKRFVRAQVGSGPDPAFRVNSKIFQQSNRVFPFTAYGINIQEFREEKANYYAQRSRQRFYASKLGLYVSAVPMQIVIPMFSFFTSSFDYQRAKTLLHENSATLIREDLLFQVFDPQDPYSASGQDVTIQIDFKAEFGNDVYSNQFEEWLRTNKLYDLGITLTVKYINYTFSRATSPVDQMQLIFISNSGQQIETIDNFPVASVASVSPVDGAVNVPASSVIITITFQQPMIEESVLDALGFTPQFDYHFAWDPTSTILTITPDADLASGTLFNLQILKTAENGFEMQMDQDFLSTFTTA